MDKLLTYINGLPLADREPFAVKCGTTIGYLRNACSTKKKMSLELCLSIATESANAVRPEDLRPDVDWVYMRNAMLLAQAPANQGQPATEQIAQGA